MSYPRRSIRAWRYAVQAFFLLFTLYIGWQFHQFVLHYEEPGRPFVPRPDAVDAFLPIGGLMAFKYLLFTGIVEPVHPAGLTMFVAICGVSLLFRRGFCGWICPVGTVSQYLWMAGEKLFGRTFRIPRYPDLALRLVKYILLGFFIVVIGIAMAPNMMLLFFITDYYKLVDVRMLKFFTDMTSLTFWTLVVLGILSVLTRNFWCRYLCPYGALLGILALASPARIARNDENCIHCGACSRECPTLIDVEQKGTVASAECFGCLTCVSHCPSKGALDVAVRWKGTWHAMKPMLLPVVMLAVFYLVIGLGMLMDAWRSKVQPEDYQRVMPLLKKEYEDRR